MDGFFKYPEIQNEPILDYAPGSDERAQFLAALKALRAREVDVPMVIGGQEVRTDNKHRLAPPHDHKHTLGHYHRGDKSHVKQAVDAALAAKPAWENMAPEDRAAIFLKAADLIAGPYRMKLNAATMLAQSKTMHQAEIDSACELIDFLRFNVQYMTDLYKIQPGSSRYVWNRSDYRPLEGFVFAITPFNFTAISGNLPTAPALMGNTVVWKPADSQIYSANVVMEILLEAGLPDGVINLIFTDGPDAGDVIFEHEDFAGLHFTGSTAVFKHLWKTIGANIDKYKSYPRIVGETGGKDFIVAHQSANPRAVGTGITRGAFEFQGQKCSAASRAYVSASISEEAIKHAVAEVNSFKKGSPEEPDTFFSAVIDEKAFDKIAAYVDHANNSSGCDVLTGGSYDKSKGYFIEPTIVKVSDPMDKLMQEEIFGPVLAIYVFDDDKWEETLDLVDKTSPYGLTGAIFAKDREVIVDAARRLRHAAGNFYINDKPTGAVVNQQPFGGARGSGTNDKAGSMLNLLRWTSPRSIKENFVTPTDYWYPFMGKE